jgi:hypothetical protein
MDAEWEDQFKKLDLKMPPSEYWRRQCYATCQSDPHATRCWREVDSKRRFLSRNESLASTQRGTACRVTSYRQILVTA